MGVTAEIVSFVCKTKFNDIPEEVVGLARGFVLDGLGVILFWLHRTRSEDSP